MADEELIHLFEESCRNEYAVSADARHHLEPQQKVLIALAGVAVLVFIGSAIMPTNIFSASRADRSLSTLCTEAGQSFQYLIMFFTGTQSHYSAYVLEIFATFLAGAALGISGGVYQGSMKNALASPSTLGVTSGGQLGAIIYVLFISPNLKVGGYMTLSEYVEALEGLSTWDYLLQTWGEVLACLAGCFLIVALIMLIALAAGRGKVSNVALVVAGQVFTAVIGVVLTWLRYYYELFGDETTATLISSLQTVSFAGPYTTLSMAIFTVPLLLCFGVVAANSGKLALLAFNDEEARSMGISVSRTRNAMVAVCTLMTALVIAFCGPIGFVGFMVPHVARRLVGPNFKYLLPACGLCGAVLVALAHCVSELGIAFILTGSTGMITSIIGSAFFVVAIFTQRETSNDQWV